MIYTVDLDQVDIDAESGRLVLRQDSQRRATLPLKKMQRVVVVPPATVSTRALAAMAEHGVGLLCAGGRHSREPVHILPHSGDAGLRLAQARFADDECARSTYGAKLIGSKIAASLQLLKAQNQNRTVKTAVAKLEAARQRMQSASFALETLRGIEGAAAAAFFEAYATLMPPKLGFDGRNRRPPKDPVNACLSLGYTLAFHEALQVCASHGLDAAMPGLHDLAPTRPALACDVMEPARALVDAWVLKRFVSGVQGRADFSLENGACLLLKPAREGFYRAWADDLQPKVLQAAERAVALYLAALKPKMQAAGP